MRHSIKTTVAALAILSCGTMAAQNTYSGYFLENYTYRFQENPAFGNEDNFVSMPALGNINVGMQGNLHLTKILYNVDGETVLFTNPGVPESAANKFKNSNKLGANVKIDLLSGGFKSWGGYNTVSFGVRANANVSAPGSFFRLAKEGIENKTYDIKDLTMGIRAFGQLAFNHSRDIPQVPGLRAGAAMKFYLGVGNVDAYFDRASLSLGEDSWKAVTNANIYASASGLKYKMRHNKHTGRDYVDGIDYDFKGLNGFGIGFDLGAQYKWQDFEFSLALLDLGFISWGKTQWASTNGDREIDTDAYIFNANDEADNSFKNEWRLFRDDLAELYQLENNGEKSSRTRAVAATLNIGVGYEFPLYRPLKFGFLSSTVINGRYSWSQARFSANVAPLDWVSASANLEVSTYGCGFGWLVNFYTKGINVFLGMDHTMGKLAKQGVPLNSNAACNIGINFPF